MHGTYLFAQGRDGLYIIDQHAAQERVKYEEYRESIGNVDQSQQQLLVPYIFEFPADDALRLKERMALLEEVGVFLAEYGENQFILREHPIWMAEEEIESGIYEMCDMLLFDQGSFYQEIPGRAGYHDVLQAVYQGKSSYRWPFG